MTAQNISNRIFLPQLFLTFVKCLCPKLAHQTEWMKCFDGKSDAGRCSRECTHPPQPRCSTSSRMQSLLLDCLTLLLFCNSAGQPAVPAAEPHICAATSSHESSQGHYPPPPPQSQFSIRVPGVEAAPGRHVVPANGRLGCTSASREWAANENLGGRSRHSLGSQ